MSDINIKINVQEGQATRAVKNLGTQASKTEKQFRSLSLGIRQGSSALSSFAGNLAANAVTGFARSVAGLVGSAIESARSIEDLSVKFEVLTGSTAGAQAVLKDLTDFTARTPFRLEGVASAAQTLIAFGFEADTITDRLQDLGDVSAASGADIGDISLIFGQVAAAGKLTGERLLQLQERAIPIGPALAETLGVAESAVRDLVSQGKVDFATFEQAFNSLNEEGNFAFGGIGKASQTLSGLISTLQDNLSLLAADVGAQLGPALKAVTTTVIEAVQSFRGFITSSTSIADTTQIAVSVFEKLVQTLGFVAQAFQGIRAFFVFAASGLQSLVTLALGASEALVNLAVTAERLTGVDVGAAGLAKDLGDLKQISSDAAAGLREDATDIATSIVTIEESSDNFLAKLRENTQEQINLAAKAAEAETGSAEKQAVANQQKLEQLSLFEEARLAIRQQSAEQEATIEQFKSDQTFQTLVEGLGREQAAQITADAQKLQQEGKTAQASQKIQENLSKAKATIQQQELQDQQRFLSTAAQLQSSGNKNLVAIGKAAALTQIAIDTQEAAASSFTFGSRIGGPVLGAAFAGIAIAAQTARAAQVAGLQFQDGGIVPGSSFSGDRVPARVNSGEMILNRGQQQNLFDSINSGQLGGGQEIVVHTSVQLDGAEIGRAVSRQVADGLTLGESL